MGEKLYDEGCTCAACVMIKSMPDDIDKWSLSSFVGRAMYALRLREPLDRADVLRDAMAVYLWLVQKLGQPKTLEEDVANRIANIMMNDLSDPNSVEVATKDVEKLLRRMYK